MADKGVIPSGDTTQTSVGVMPSGEPPGRTNGVVPSGDTTQTGVGVMPSGGPLSRATDTRHTDVPLGHWYRSKEVNQAGQDYIERITAKVAQTLTERQAALDKKCDDELTEFMSRVEHMMARIEGTPHQGERQTRRDLGGGQQRQTSSDRPIDNRASSLTLTPLTVAATQTVGQTKPSTDEEHIVIEHVGNVEPPLSERVERTETEGLFGQGGVVPPDLNAARASGQGDELPLDRNAPRAFGQVGAMPLNPNALPFVITHEHDERNRELDSRRDRGSSQESQYSDRERNEHRYWEDDHGSMVNALSRRAEPKYKNVLAKLGDFHGSKRDTMKWERWVARFDLHFEVANIGQSHYVRLLGEHLQGAAYEIYKGIIRLEPDIFWTELEAKLKGHFQPETNPTLQLAEYNCAAWEYENDETLNEFVTRLQGYMHEGLPAADAKTKELLIRVKLWESLPLRWKTQIETSHPNAALSEVVKLAIEIQTKEKADKGVHRITDALKCTFKDRPGDRDFDHKRDNKFGSSANRNFLGREKPNFDKIQNSDRGRSQVYQNRGSRRYATERSYNDRNTYQQGFQSTQRQGFTQPPQRQESRRGVFTPTQKFQGGNLTPNRANFGNASSNRSAGQPTWPDTKRVSFGAPSRGSTQAAAYQQSSYSSNEYKRQGRNAPNLNSGPRPWEQYLRTAVNSVVTQVNAAGHDTRPRKCPVWTIDVQVRSRCANALFDMGSTISIISLKQFTQYADGIGPQEAARQLRKVTETHRALSGHPLPFLGLIDVVITVGNDIGVVPCYILKETLTALLLGDTFAEVFGARCIVGNATRHEWSVAPGGRTTKGAARFSRSMGERASTVCHVVQDTKVMAGCRATITCRAPVALIGEECLVQIEVDESMRKLSPYGV